MTTWSPDTCDCVIRDYDTPAPLFLVRCRQHEAATRDNVLAHNRAFNALYTLMDMDDIVKIGKLKDDEKKRIREL